MGDVNNNKKYLQLQYCLLIFHKQHKPLTVFLEQQLKFNGNNNHFSKKILFIYLPERQGETEHKQGEREREKQAPAEQGARCALHPRTLGPQPQPKADTQ